LVIFVFVFDYTKLGISLRDIFFLKSNIRSSGNDFIIFALNQIIFSLIVMFCTKISVLEAHKIISEIHIESLCLYV